MDSRSPLAFLQQNNDFAPFNTFPRLVTPNKAPPPPRRPSPPSTKRTPPPPSQPQKVSPVTKRKASFADEDEDSVMSTSPQPAPRTLKRYRASPPSSNAQTTKRPLPLPRLLDNLEKPALVAILNQLVSRHPELSPEIQSVAPKLTPQTALQAISKLEDTLHQSFPYGGDKAGEYAYSRVHASLSALLQAIQEYTRHFLPPQSPVSAAEVLAFLDGTTGVLGRVPGFANPIHNLAREAVAGETVSAWEVGVRWFIETNGAFAFGMGGWLEKIERHADKVEGLRRVAEVIREQISWINH